MDMVIIQETSDSTLVTLMSWPGATIITLVKNAICPLGKHPKKNKNVLSVPCKSEQQGKKQLIEFVNAFSNDKSIQTTVAQWLASRKKMAFDRDTIPQELLDSA